MSLWPLVAGNATGAAFYPYSSLRADVSAKFIGAYAGAIWI